MEPTLEDQAALAVVLDDKVRELVRRHLAEALQDATFMTALNPFPLSTLVANGLLHDYNFQSAVKQVMINQMHK